MLVKLQLCRSLRSRLKKCKFLLNTHLVHLEIEFCVTGLRVPDQERTIVAHADTTF
jgi:hypothetical protein